MGGTLYVKGAGLGTVALEKAGYHDHGARSGVLTTVTLEKKEKVLVSVDLEPNVIAL